MPSEQIGAWLYRNVNVPKQVKRLAAKNEAISDDEVKTYLKGHFCTRPFQRMETTDTGSVLVCCPDWLPTPIGEIDDLSSCWTSKAVNKIRASIIDGTYKYCSHLDCTEIANRQLMDRDNPEAKALIEQFETHGTAPPPRELTLSHDRSCNLSCPSCRTEMLVAKKPKQKRLDDLVETSLLPTLKQVKQVYITASGDPFGSAHFRRLIKRLRRDEFPDLVFRLHTNAQLWDARAWAELDLAGRVDSAHVSIDATDEETYAIVRRGGTFARLLKNLEFVKTLRDSGELRILEVSMVVQSINYRQMPDFVRLGRSISADAISFQMIRNWGIFTPEEFEKIYIGRDHPEFDGLLDVLKSPEFDHPSVELGNVLEDIRLKTPPMGRPESRDPAPGAVETSAA